jgi:hypothetical protein
MGSIYQQGEEAEGQVRKWLHESRWRQKKQKRGGGDEPEHKRGSSGGGKERIDAA